MANEQDIVSALTKKFSFLENNIRIQRPRRIFASLSSEKFEEVFKYAVDNMKFSVLSAITGLDEGQTLGVLYHIACKGEIILSLKINVPKEKPVLQTITSYFPGAEVYERELVDLLGADVKGLGPGKRYPLPDDWPAGEYPLRKDWKAKNPPFLKETR